MASGSRAAQAGEGARSHGSERHDLLAVGFRGREQGILPVAAAGERVGGWQNKVRSHDALALRSAGAVERGAGRPICVGVINQAAGRRGGSGDGAPLTGDGGGALDFVSARSEAGETDAGAFWNQRDRNRRQSFPVDDGREVRVARGVHGGTGHDDRPIGTEGKAAKSRIINARGGTVVPLLPEGHTVRPRILGRIDVPPIAGHPEAAAQASNHNHIVGAVHGDRIGTIAATRVRVVVGLLPEERAIRSRIFRGVEHG